MDIKGQKIHCAGMLFLLIGFFALLETVLPRGVLSKPYYEGKVITIVVGSQPGGGYDRIARLLAKHLPAHIPGKPVVIVQNMPGGSSMTAANYVYNKAEPDGLTLASVIRGVVFMQLLKADGVKFDMAKFPFIGSVAAESNVLCIRNDLPYKTFEEFREASRKKPVFLGGSGPGTVNTQMANISNDFLGVNQKIVDYRSSGEVELAMERKELDAMWQAYNSAKPAIKRGLFRPILRSWVSQKGIEHLPVNEDFTTDPVGKAILGLMGRTGVITRPYFAPPKTPSNVLEILREAFMKTLKDPKLQADAEKSLLDLEYTPWKECVALVHYSLNQPPEIVKAFQKYVAY